MMGRLGRPGSPHWAFSFFGGWGAGRGWGGWGLADDNDAIVVGLIIIISLK